MRVAADFEERLLQWAEKNTDVEALVLGGSRANLGSSATNFDLDWDFHLYSTRPEKYSGTSWLEEIDSVASSYSRVNARGVTKVSAYFVSGAEVDFVPLAAWQMRVVFTAMRYPQYQNLMPQRLLRGIAETRAFLLGSGFRLLVGGAVWARRLESLSSKWNSPPLTGGDFMQHCSAFWTTAVWMAKRILRAEARSAMHWLHMISVNHTYTLLAEEARLAGRSARPEARKAEQWLDERRLAQTAIATSVDPKQLAHAMLQEVALFEEVSRSVAISRGFDLPDHSAVAGWIREQLEAVLR